MILTSGLGFATKVSLKSLKKGAFSLYANYLLRAIRSDNETWE